MKKLIIYSCVIGAITCLASCKTTTNTQKKVSINNENLVNYISPEDVRYPLADTALKYSSPPNISYVLKENMNVQTRAMVDNLSKYATVLQFGESIIISLDRGNVFKSDDFTLNESTQDILRKIAFNLSQNTETYILAVGRTDNTGTVEYNKNLAYKRAAVAANYLAGCGIEKDRLFVDTFGEKFPDFSNKIRSTRNLNRRIDLMIIPSNSMRKNAELNIR